MSRFIENLRSRLATAFKLAPAPDEPVQDTTGVTFTAYLPDEDSAIDAVFAVRRHRKMSAASAERIEAGENVTGPQGLPWRIAMTFYLPSAEKGTLEGEIAEIVAPFGGLMESAPAASADRQAA
jgi:hypothetical protein